MEQYKGEYNIVTKIKMTCQPIIVPNICAKELNYLLKESGCCEPGQEWAKKYDLRAYIKHMPPEWQRITYHYFYRVANAIHFKWPEIDVEPAIEAAKEIERGYDYIYYEMLDLRAYVEDMLSDEERVAYVSINQKLKDVIQERKRRLMATLIQIEEGPKEIYHA